jgi:selenocysteine-specific elongation factor
MTIAGGTVLRRTDEKFRRKDEKSYIEFLSQLNSSLTKRSELLRTFVNDAADRGIALGEIRSLTGWTAAALEDAKNSSDEVLEYDGTFISKASFAAVEARALESAERFHSTDRLAKSVSLEILRAEAFKFVRPEIERAVLNSLTTKGKLSLKGDEIMLAGREVQHSDSESKAIASMRNKFSAAGLEVPKLETLLAETAASTGVSPDVIRKLFHQLLDAGEFVRINSEFCVSSKVVDDLIMKVRDSAGRSADRLVDVSKFKDIAGVSRKYAIPLLEYFDQRKVTVRRGDKRFVL